MNEESSVENKDKILFKNLGAVLVALVLFIGSLVGNYFFKNEIKTKESIISSEKKEISDESELNKSTSDTQVLGYDSRVPQIYIYGGRSDFSSGGVISLASTDEPAIKIGGSNFSGLAEIKMYEANDLDVLNYLIHDENDAQIKKTPDVSKFQYITTVYQDFVQNGYEGIKVTFPFKDKGIWYLRVKVGAYEADAFVIRSDIGVTTQEGDKEFIFWGQNFKTRRSITDGNIKLFNLEDSTKELQTVSFNAEGIAKANLTGEADIAWIIQNDDRALIPINLKYMNYDYNYHSFESNNRDTRYFIFTDRPLYQPGDTVYFKAVLREDDDARYSIPNGQAKVSIYSGYSYEDNKQPLFTKEYSISSDGTINGEYTLPASAMVGNHSLVVQIPNQSTASYWWDSDWSSNQISFDVQFFRKPESWIDIVDLKNELIVGDKTSFTIKGEYFSGQPLANQKVKYVIVASDFYEYDYFTEQQMYENISDESYRYNHWYGSNNVATGTTTLDLNGLSVIDLDSKIKFNKGKSQVFTIEATLEDGSENPSFSRKNLLVYAGEYGIYKRDYSYGAKVNVPLTIPIQLKSYRSNTDVSGIELVAKIHRQNWIAYQEPKKKYLSFKSENEDLEGIKFKSDISGKGILEFTPKKNGSYTFQVEGKDSRGNIIAKTFYSYVSSEDYPYYNSGDNNDLTMVLDKKKYQLNDIAKISIYSTIPDRDVFLSFQRGRVSRYQVVKMNGNKAQLDVQLVASDIPNIFAQASSFSTYKLDRVAENLSVSSDLKKLIVNIVPNSKTYSPGESVTVNVSTTDISGNPVSADVALWSVDKAIFELSDNRLGDIFNTYWRERYNSTSFAHSLEGISALMAEGGGCFVSGTSVMMADGDFKNIEDVRIGESVMTRTEIDPQLVKAKVTGTHVVDEDGYIILNSNLKVTPNHIIWVNNSWKEAGSVQKGDVLVDTKGDKVFVRSVEWQRAKVKVYNLEIDKYHTYFAGGVWVHNQKGEERSVFKDTAYWNPSLRTDSSGRAQVTYKLPDNLTTWILASVGSTVDTKVGQTTSEIVVTKDVIVRPIIPNILRTGDRIELSALVQNYTEIDHIFDIKLNFEAGEVVEPIKKNVLIPSGGFEQFYWSVTPTMTKENAKLEFSALVTDNPKIGDTVIQKIDVKPFGFVEKRVETGEGNKTYDLNLAVDSSIENSKVILSISPTILGMLPTAMKYLVNYPYGCVEQTTSRFVPAVIAKVNSKMFSDSLEEKDVDDMIKKGISRLATLQQYDGGWNWWFTGSSDPFITSYVVDYLIQARQSGIEVDQAVLDKAAGYLSKSTRYDSTSQKEVLFTNEELIARNYGMTLLGSKDQIYRMGNWNNLSADILSMAVITNYLNGDKNPETNGLSKLESMAQSQGDNLYWNSGKKDNFGSKDASTAWAIRAIVTAGGDRKIATKGAMYLTKNRKYDYWSNTYATAQIIRAVVELSKTGNELNPNYGYKVLLDGKQIAQGKVTNSKQILKDVNLDVKSIKDTGSKIEVLQQGDGQMYTTLVVNDFRTDRNALVSDQGLFVIREYVNEKGEEYSLGVGDTVRVGITISGLEAEENYGVIQDELPAGLVPINESFKNEQYFNSGSEWNYYDGISDREITQNGIVLSLYRVSPGYKKYSYRARVVSEGEFIVPPVTASLMYAPEINGRSSVQTVKVTKESEFVSQSAKMSVLTKQVKERVSQKSIQLITSVVISILSIVGIIWMRKISKKSKSSALLDRNPVSENVSENLNDEKIENDGK